MQKSPNLPTDTQGKGEIVRIDDFEKIMKFRRKEWRCEGGIGEKRRKKIKKRWKSKVFDDSKTDKKNTTVRIQLRLSLKSI